MIKLRVRHPTRADVILQVAGLAAFLMVPPLVVAAHGGLAAGACRKAEACFDYDRWECRYNEEPPCPAAFALFPPQQRWVPAAAGAAWIVGASAIVLGQGRRYHRHL